MWVLFVGGLLWARPNSGSSLTSAGGGAASVMEMSVLGMSINPASAYTDRFQLKFDVGMLTYRMFNQIAGDEQSIVEERYGEIPDDWNPISGEVKMSGAAPAGSFGMCFPVGPFAIGLETFVPYGTGARLDENGAQRFFTTGGYLIFAEQDFIVSLPVAVNKNRFTFGVALRGGVGLFSNSSASDTGLLIYQQTGEQEKELILDPLFEGSRTYYGSGTGFGYALGLHWENPHFSTHLAYRSPVTVPMTGRYELLLSKAFTLQLEADLQVDMTFPAEAYLGFSIPFWKIDMLVETGWASWSTRRYLSGVASNLELKSEDAFFQSILGEYGLTTNELLTADQSFFQDSGTHDSVFAEVAVRIPWTDSLVSQTGVKYSTSTVPVGYGSMSNSDYNTINLRGILRWRAMQKLSFIFSSDYMIKPKRIVNNSVYSIFNDSQEGLNGFSGNGEYKLDLMRLGLTFHIHL